MHGLEGCNFSVGYRLDGLTDLGTLLLLGLLLLLRLVLGTIISEVLVN